MNETKNFIKFLGGIEGVTGSKTLMQLGDEKYLIDYGLYQGSAKTRESNWLTFRDAKNIIAVFLTHAHIDHSGLLPRLYQDGFRGKIYCSEDTYKLCKILLTDSAKIQEEDAKYANDTNYSRHKPALPLYNAQMAEEVLKLFLPIKFNKNITISKTLSCSFHWAGHIMGSSFINFKIKINNEIKKIIFSGDLGHKRNILLKKPELFPDCDILVLESTYGSKLHPRVCAKDVLEVFLNAILKRGGVAVIPSFSVGRTQDILYLISKLIKEEKIPNNPVLLDSPLSKKANAIFRKFFKSGFIKEDISKETQIFPKRFREIESIEDSKTINNLEGPFIVVSASGMIDGGRVVHHVKKRVTDKRNGIILVGFQPYGTKGRLLIDGIKDLRLHKETFDVKADIFYVDSLSAHCDYLDVVEQFKESKILPKLVILNHGEPNSSANLKSILDSTFSFKVAIAKQNEEFDLDSI